LFLKPFWERAMAIFNKTTCIFWYFLIKYIEIKEINEKKFSYSLNYASRQAKMGTFLLKKSYFNDKQGYNFFCLYLNLVHLKTYIRVKKYVKVSSGESR